MLVAQGEKSHTTQCKEIQAAQKMVQIFHVDSN